MEKKTVKQMYLYCTIYLTPFGMSSKLYQCILFLTVSDDEIS